MVRAEKSIPVLAASTPISAKTASSCARTNSGCTSSTAVTPTVFCAVSATITVEPWQPAAANAFRSAWIPAPPPESDPAIVRHRGINELPSPVRTGSGSTGVISAPQGTPVKATLANAQYAAVAVRHRDMRVTIAVDERGEVDVPLVATMNAEENRHARARSRG